MPITKPMHSRCVATSIQPRGTFVQPAHRNTTFPTRLSELQLYLSCLGSRARFPAASTPCIVGIAFTRVWTLQETYLNPNVLFHCGPYALEYLALFCGLRYAATNALVLPHDHPLWPHLMSFLQLLSRKGKDEIHAPSELLDMVRPQQCLEPRDRVYALTMMLRHLDLGKNVVPRQEDASMVFIRAAAHIIETERGFNFISKADLSRNTSRGLPSWVPDWHPAEAAHRWFNTVWRRETSSHPTNESPFWFDWRNMRELALRGVILSRICAVTEAIPEQREFLIGESLAADPSDGSVRTTAPLFRRYLEYLVKIEPLLHFAGHTQQLASQPSKTWKAFIADDTSYARSKGWNESFDEWQQMYETYAQDI